MTKQEQIEEMANYYCEYCKKQTGEKFCEHIDDKSCNIFFEAELFYNAGYRKVICDRDNFTDLLNEETKELSLIEKTRKETAKEIYERLIELSENPCNDREEIYKEVFGRYGMEVEE